jgi:hypothetical protein
MIASLAARELARGKQMDTGRRMVLGSVAALVFGSPRAFAQTPAPAPGLRSIAVLQIELLDEQNNPATKAAQEVRLGDALLQLREELRARGLYRVVDPAPTQALQDKLRAQQEFFYRCDDCAAQVGQQLGVDLVMTPWVQKVSELILNFNVQIFDVAAGKVIFSKSVDMRGNDNDSWKRAVRYLARDMAEKRSINPRYGQ